VLRYEIVRALCMRSIEVGNSKATTAINIAAIWDRLAAVRKLTFQSKSNSVTRSGWDGEGSGEVKIEQSGPSMLVFHEKGTWKTSEGRQIPFSNIFRWTLDEAGTTIRLEHLRFGPSRPVLLFDLVPATERSLESSCPHVCSEDCYSARMEVDPSVIHLDWKVAGPKTDEAISYCYQ
jgi:hypothetical protein